MLETILSFEQLNLSYLFLGLLIFLTLILLLTFNLWLKVKNIYQSFEQHFHHNEQRIAELSQQYVAFQQQHNTQLNDAKLQLLKQQHELASQFNDKLVSFTEQSKQGQLAFQQQISEQQTQILEKLLQNLNHTAFQNRQELTQALEKTTQTLNQRVENLTESTKDKLQQISQQVDQRLSDGFEKTTKTFNDILQRLALIDDAQKKITELSSNVVSLQQVLNDKRSRGAFGEVQLNALIRNVLPEQHFSIQHTLSNGKIADCILFLPKPTGNVVIDAKFPLESFKRLMDEQLPDSEKALIKRQFKQDIKKHIHDIGDKYIIENETADGAIMFIPAEAVFAEIHAHHSDLVELANQKRVWLASPTTLMAILTTVRSVIKDEATREQIHIIQSHLSHLSADFARFRQRFNNLAKHIDQAALDVKQIHTSADKISSRFEKIEQVELADSKQPSKATLVLDKVDDN
jgi:DNA recombination protein RmuC